MNANRFESSLLGILLWEEREWRTNHQNEALPGLLLGKVACAIPQGIFPSSGVLL